MSQPRRILIVGAGLIGTSVALALRAAHWPVFLADRDPDVQALACDIAGAEPGEPASLDELDVALVCVPPNATIEVTQRLHQLMPSLTISDVSSIKTNLQQKIDSLSSMRAIFVGGHPIAGRELSGPQAARADLFEGRPWVLTPTEKVASDRVAVVTDVAKACGAVPIYLSTVEHDRMMALVSHGPQLVAAALAARLTNADALALSLAGPGLRDTTRIAGSDPALWEQILVGNAAEVAEVVAEVAADLERAAQALRATSQVPQDATGSVDPSISRLIDPAVQILRAGHLGHAQIPGKHGFAAVEYTGVPVVIPDEPGALAKLFAAAGEVGVNIEDVAIEHSPGQPVGLIELSVAPDQAETLRKGLAQAGWSVH